MSYGRYLFWDFLNQKESVPRQFIRLKQLLLPAATYLSFYGGSAGGGAHVLALAGGPAGSKCVIFYGVFQHLSKKQLERP